MPRKVFGNKKKFWGPLKHQKIYFFQKWTFGVVPTMALVTRMSHKSSNVVEPRFTSRNHAPETIFLNFWIFEIHHLKMPSYLNKDLDCCYQCCIEYWNIFENFLPNIDIHIRFIAISLCLGLIKKGWSQNLHRYGIAILLYLVLLGCKKLITRHSHTWFCDESKIMGHKTSQKA